MRKLIVSTAILAVSLGSTSVFAVEKGDFILRWGAATVSPNEDSDELNLNDAPITGAEKVNVDNDTQLGITMTYMFTDNWGLGILAATPFEHDIEGDGGITDGVDVGTVKHLPPTITAQYHFNNSSIVTPYIGLGVNYTAFFSEDLDSEVEAAVSGLGLGMPSDLDLDDSWGLAAEFGVDVEITENWLFNATVWYIDIDTEGSFDTSAGHEFDVDVEIDPWVYMVGVGYKF